MTGKQQAVLWSGILLIILRMTTTGQWSLIWNTVSVKQKTPSANQSSAPVQPSVPESVSV